MENNNNNCIVCVDMDNTIFPFMENLCELYNKAYNDNISINTFDQYDVSPFIKCSSTDFFKLCDDDFFNSLIPYPYCKEYLDLLHKDKVKIYFLTAGFPHTILSRHNLLKKTFDWYSSEQLIMSRNKSLIDCDVMIDDYLDNLLNSNHALMRILIDMPWNRNEELRKEVDGVFNSWKEVYDKAVKERCK